MPNQVRGMTPEAIRALFKRGFDAQADALTLKLSNYNDEVSAMKQAMDDSLEALNKDVGSSIEKATSEAKRANDAIVALNAFDKAVASQISGMLDQSQSAIAEANALLAQMPEFEKKTQDAIDKAENVSNSLANYKKSQQKLLDELNKKADGIQGELAAQDSKMAQAQADWSKDFEALKKSVNQSVDGITKGLSKAVEDQLKISPSLKALTDKLDSTNDSLSKLNKDYDSVSKKVSDITGQVEPLSKQAQQAATDAQKAVDALRNPKDIGTSILTIDQITGEPHWTKDARPSTEKTPDGESVYYVTPSDKISHELKASRVVVDPRIPYKIEFWARADPPGNQLSSSYFGKGYASPFLKVEGNIPSRNHYLPYKLNLPSKWTKYEAVVRFKPEVESVVMKDFSWNSLYGSKDNVNQYIGGFKFFPLIPDQAEIDRLQNNAILKNTKIGESNTNAIDAINEGMKAQATLNKKQQEWNAVQKIVNDKQQGWNKAQETVNKNQSKWNQAVTDYQKLNDRLWGKQGEINKLNQAIDANQTELLAVNTRAIKSLTNGQNLIPYYQPSNEEVANGWSEWTRPVWASLDLKRNVDESVYKGFAYYTFASEKSPAQYINFDIDPSLEYDYEVWLRGTEGGIAFIECRDEHGSHAIKSGGIVGDNRPDFVSSSGIYLVSYKKTHPKWTKYKTRIKFNDGVRRVSIRTIYANHKTGVQPATLDIGEDMRLYPHIPSQDDVNKALKDADKALKDQIDANTKIDQAQTKADEGFYKAIKALSMPEEANSLFAYIEPSDAEIKAAYESGKSSSIVYDQPEWTLFGHEAPSKIGDSATMKEIRGEWSISANNSQGYKEYPNGRASLMPIIKGISYKLSFWAYASDGSTQIFFTFKNQNDKECFSHSVGYIDGQKVPSLDVKKDSMFVSNYISLRNGYHKYEFRLDFTPDTTAVRLDNVGWHFSNTKGIQRIVGMRFLPDIPSQAEIDKAQNNAIINNSNAITINNWSDKIQAIVNDNQQKEISYLKSLQISAQRSQRMNMPRYIRINIDERWSRESSDFDEYFSVTKDKNFWDGTNLDFIIKGKHSGLLDVHYRYKVSVGGIGFVPLTSQTQSYIIENGEQLYRGSDGQYGYYYNVRLKFPGIRTMYDILLIYHPSTLPSGSVPDIPSPPNLNTSFPPKPTLRELE